MPLKAPAPSSGDHCTNRPTQCTKEAPRHAERQNGRRRAGCTMLGCRVGGGKVSGNDLYEPLKSTTAGRHVALIKTSN